MKVYEHSCLGDDVHICANKQRTLSHFCCAEVLLCDSICLCVWINACFFKLLSIHVKAEYIKSPHCLPSRPYLLKLHTLQISAPAAPFRLNCLLYTKMRRAIAWKTSQVSSLFPTSLVLILTPIFSCFFFFFNLPLFCLDAGWWNPEEESGWLGVV